MRRVGVFRLEVKLKSLAVFVDGGNTILILFANG